MYAHSAGSQLLRSRDGLLTLPDVPYVLLMAYSPWWSSSRRAAVELDRLAEALLSAGVWEDLRVLTVDCSQRSARVVCSSLLGQARPVTPVLQEGVHAPKIGELGHSTFADPWPRDAMPTLLLGAREDLLAELAADALPTAGAGALERGRVLARAALAPTSAEAMLEWLRTSRVEASGLVSLDHVRLMPQVDFWHSLQGLRGQFFPLQGPETTQQGCQCKAMWRHCDRTVWNNLHIGEEQCRMYHGCPPRLGFCETVGPCGAARTAHDACAAAAISGAGAAAGSEGGSKDASRSKSRRSARYADERDAQAAFALWLHDIFERTPFELPEDDPRQMRRTVLLDLLQMLCTYWPDHLEGGQRPRESTTTPGSECRESLCRLGSMLRSEQSWLHYTEVVHVHYYHHEDEALGALPPPPPAREQHVRRILWEKLERDWWLCARSWIAIARRGFAACDAADPLERGLPCGVWVLLHGLVVEDAVEKECPYKRVENPDECEGPPTNSTRDQAMRLRRTHAKEDADAAARLRALWRHNATLPAFFSLRREGGPEDVGDCLRSRGKDKTVAVNVASNATMTVVVDSFASATALLKGRAHPAAGLGDLIPVEFQLWQNNVTGTVGLRRILRGPLQLQRALAEHWTLVELGGSRVASSPGGGGGVLEWKTMLGGVIEGRTELILEGPVECRNASNLHAVCARCADFEFVRDAEQPAHPWDPVGRLREPTTGQCLSHIWRKAWFGLQAWDIGLGLQQCDSAEKFQLGTHRLARNDTFCSLGNATECFGIQRGLLLPNYSWVPVHVLPEMTSLPLTHSEVIARIERAVQHFWNGAAARSNFILAARRGRRADLSAATAAGASHGDGPGGDEGGAVLWLWRVHNDITFRLRMEAAQLASRFPPDLEMADVAWPPASLCRSCRSCRSCRGRAASAEGASQASQASPGAGRFNESAVYRFIVEEFYASKLLRAKQGAARQQELGAEKPSWANFHPAFGALQTGTPSPPRDRKAAASLRVRVRASANVSAELSAKLSAWLLPPVSRGRGPPAASQPPRWTFPALLAVAAGAWAALRIAVGPRAALGGSGAGAQGYVPVATGDLCNDDMPRLV